ncbi:hypothetical protein GCM10009623_03490 [Nocardioides aestuarii]
MDFLLDPRSAVLTGQLTERSLHLTDTPPRERGAQFVSISRQDGLLVAEVEELVELDYPHRAVSVNLTSPGNITVAYTCAASTSGGTDYTQEVWMSPGPGRAAHLQGLFESETERSVNRIKQVLEAGEWTAPGE